MTIFLSGARAAASMSSGGDGDDGGGDGDDNDDVEEGDKIITIANMNTALEQRGLIGVKPDQGRFAMCVLHVCFSLSATLCSVLPRLAHLPSLHTPATATLDSRGVTEPHRAKRPSRCTISSR